MAPCPFEKLGRTLVYNVIGSDMQQNVTRKIVRRVIISLTVRVNEIVLFCTLSLLMLHNGFLAIEYIHAKFISICLFTSQTVAANPTFLYCYVAIIFFFHVFLLANVPPSFFYIEYIGLYLLILGIIACA